MGWVITLAFAAMFFGDRTLTPLSIPTRNTLPPRVVLGGDSMNVRPPTKSSSERKVIARRAPRAAVPRTVDTTTVIGMGDTVAVLAPMRPSVAMSLVFICRDSLPTVPSLAFSFTTEFPELNEPGAFEKLAWVFGASLAFSAADYVGSNLTEHSQESHIVFKYRLVQYIVQLGISYVLYKKVGLPSALAFNVFWWCFGDDMLYYCIAETVSPGGKFEGRGSLARVVNNGVYHAGWTPVGIARGGARRAHIAGDTILAQSLVGLGLAVTITISF